MKIQTLFLIIGLILFANFLLGQSAKEQRKIDRFTKHLVELDTIKAIKKNREECEKLVRELKYTGKGSESLIKQYEITKLGYDAVLDAMISDINQASTIGGLVEYLIKDRKQRRTVYADLSRIANESCKEFITNAHNALAKEKGPIKDLIDWAFSLLPKWITEISDASFEVVRKILIKKLEEIRFKDWKEI